MENADATNRRGKRVDDGDSMAYEPVPKSARKETETASDLSKNELDIELEKRLTELRQQLTEARNEVDDVNNKKSEIARENDALKIAMIEVRRIEEVLSRDFTSLKEDFETAKQMHFEQAAEIFTLKNELAEAKKINETVNNLRVECFEKGQENIALKFEVAGLRRTEGEAKDELTRVTGECTRKDRELDEAKIRECDLNSKGRELAQENASIMQELDKTRRNAEVDRIRDQQRIAELTRNASLIVHSKGDPINIFQLLCPNNRSGYTLDNAVKELQCAAYDRQLNWEQLNTNDKKLACAVCEKDYKMSEVVNHFLSRGHRNKASVHDASVSKAAVKYWKEQIEKVTHRKVKDEISA